VLIDPMTTAPASIYKLLIGCVVPRPIAWVSTVGANGINNLAPFSFFMGVCNDPPTIAFSSGPRGGDIRADPSGPRGGDVGGAAGGKKDTVVNLEHTGDFVVNVVDDTLAEQMNLTSGEYPADVDEFVMARLTAAPGVKVRAPRVAEAPISMECRVAQILAVGRGPHSLVLGEIVQFHVRDDLYDVATGRIDMRRLAPVGRLAGHLYTHVHEIFAMKRPNDRYAG
jgi:flavin reductase (DIM6/NTAB) family NADH-FMN oxidoreductase RutF